MPPANRIQSIDLLRGIVMVIMALDHTRDFFHFDAFIHDPLDVATTSPALFLTRWITHFCAPIFVFLSGTSIYLQSLRKSPDTLRAFLLKRGVWIMLCDLVLITFMWEFSLSFSVLVVQVLFVIGISMFIIGLMTKLPDWIHLTLGFVLVFGHNILDFIPSTHSGFFWDFTRNGNFVMYPPEGPHRLLIIYPFVPWLGLMLLGYSIGRFFSPEVDAAYRKKFLVLAGTGTLLLFVLLRFINVYGDPHPWSVQPAAAMTALSFLNVHKYPPSLLYLCVTIGPGLLFLAFFEKTDNIVTRFFNVVGKTPFFYYLLHFYLLHVLCMILFLMRGHSFSEQLPDIFGVPMGFLIAGEGYSLKVVYFIWMLVVLALYPLCVLFGRLKQTKSWWWLSYL